jgi:hypothetical protein
LRRINDYPSNGPTDCTGTMIPRKDDLCHLECWTAASLAKNAAREYRLASHLQLQTRS